jgi:hypothetical protein
VQRSVRRRYAVWAHGPDPSGEHPRAAEGWAATGGWRGRLPPPQSIDHAHVNANELRDESCVTMHSSRSSTPLTVVDPAEAGTRRRTGAASRYAGQPWSCAQPARRAYGRLAVLLPAVFLLRLGCPAPDEVARDGPPDLLLDRPIRDGSVCEI